MPTATATEPARQAPRRIAVADLIGGVLLVVVMAGAWLLTRDWDDKAAVFPRGIALGGVVLGVVLVVRSLVGTRRAPVVPDAEELEDDLDYVFHTASGRQWLVTLAWFGGFFVSLYVLGLYPTSIVFTVLYLHTQDRRSWLFSGIYALVLTGALYLAFTVALAQQVPGGLLGLA